MPKPILFCDFDGVLCFDKHWRSLPPEQYEKVQSRFFVEDTTLVNEWMRGKHTSEEVNRLVAQQTGIPFQELWDVFVEDCKTMRVSEAQLQALNALRDAYVVMLITTNMDSFNRFTIPALELKKYFDEISNSYDEGTYKSDHRGALFLKYINKHGADIEKCIALDDSPNVHETFLALGGTSYLITAEKNLDYYLHALENARKEKGLAQARS